MSRRIVLDCDRCGAEGKAETIGPFDLGDGLREVDLCIDCRASLHVDRLIALAAEYGVAPEQPVSSKAAPTGGANACPVCGDTLRGVRQNVLTHLHSIHGMSTVEASQAFPPKGPSRPCKHCGYLAAVGGGGMASHLHSAHPELVDA